MAQVLHIGNLESSYRVEKVVTELEPYLKGKIVVRYNFDDPGLYRHGDVMFVPENAIAAVMNPNTGNNAAFITSD